jgi:hypothetical protein
MPARTAFVVTSVAAAAVLEDEFTRELLSKSCASFLA